MFCSFRSARETYGDDAIGYVQVKREGDICTVKAKITPEHKVQKKGYGCVLKCNERNEQILIAECEDCAAQKGGCKHSVAFLMWLHRRSEEASPTEVKCYWAKPKLAKVGTTLKFIKAKEIGIDQTDLQISSSSGQRYFLKGVTDVLKTHSDGHKIQLFQYIKEHEGKELSVHFLYQTFMKEPQNNAENFLNYCASKMTTEKCKIVEQSTSEQSESSMWFELRYCRITASKAYEAAHCKKYDGALVEQIFGAKKIKDTIPMKRGKTLEHEVRREISKKKDIAIEKCGFFLKSDWPILGATPDGITKDYVIEIKCPTSSKTTESYIKDGIISNKCKAQIQLQMYFAEKRKCLFCIASPQFEQDKSLAIHEVDYDENYCLTILSGCTAFWKKAVLEKLQQTFA